MPLRDEKDIVLCRQAVRKLAQELKFTLVDQTEFVTAASELSRNTVIYGGGGNMLWEKLPDGPKLGLRLSFEDQGPGIADVALALTDGFTTGKGKGMGVGLSGSKRLVQEFDIRTAEGEGTCVTIGRWR